MDVNAQAAVVHSDTGSKDDAKLPQISSQELSQKVSEDLSQKKSVVLFHSRRQPSVKLRYKFESCMTL